MPVRGARLGGARYRVTMGAPVRPRDAGAAQAAQALDMSAQLNALFESWIRETPGEWMCLARRPEGARQGGARPGRAPGDHQ